MRRELAWLFFDIGSTLVDESRALESRVRETVEGSAVTFEQFYARMLEYARLQTRSYQAAADDFRLEKTPWRSQEERLYPEADELLAALSGKYRLGIIANQSPGAEKRLEGWGIRHYFSVIACSAEEGVAKPNPEIFRRALARAGCPPQRAAMIGDRLDNDIAPAKALGMTAIWVRQGIGVSSEEREAATAPDFTVNALRDLREILL